jgi:hypothetical protein
MFASSEAQTELHFALKCFDYRCVVTESQLLSPSEVFCFFSALTYGIFAVLLRLKQVKVSLICLPKLSDWWPCAPRTTLTIPRPVADDFNIRLSTPAQPCECTKTIRSRVRSHLFSPSCLTGGPAPHHVSAQVRALFDPPLLPQSHLLCCGLTGSASPNFEFDSSTPGPGRSSVNEGRGSTSGCNGCMHWPRWRRHS